MNVSTSIPTTVLIRREHLIGLLVAVALLAAAITLLLVGFANDSSATRASQSTSRPVTPAAVSVDERGTLLVFWGRKSPPAGYPQNYRGMP